MWPSGESAPCPSAAGGSSLSRVLEANGEHLRKYFLTARACLGIPCHSLAQENASRVTVAVPGENLVVRRLTPMECERLQGFPDLWTLVPFNGKPASDSVRYKALGNSMAIPCMRWVGQRLLLVSTRSTPE